MASFLDKMVSGFNKGVTDMKEGSKTFMEKSSLNTQIGDLEKTKNALFNNLGALVYQLQTQGLVEIEQCNAIKAEIDSVVQQIEERQARLQQIELEKQQAQAQAQALAQAKAQAQAQAYAQAQAAAGMAPGAAPAAEAPGITCLCGNVNKAGSAFCAHCGARLG